MCVSGIGFQFHIPSRKENILSEKKWGGGESEKSQISEIFKKSTLVSKMQYFDYQIILEFTSTVSKEDLASSMVSTRQNHNLGVLK